MMTLRQLASSPADVPSAIAWALADLGEARGKQELFTRQSPQRLKVLREHALVESALSSNRIEGVTIEYARVHPVVIGKGRLRNRDEEEVRGYRDALGRIHDRHATLSVSEKTIRSLHRVSRANIGDAGRYRSAESEIVEIQADGRRRVRFKAVAARKVPSAMAELVTLWKRSIAERWIHPVVALAASNLDFLCIHPFRDGNGRVSRLLWLLQSYHLGYDVGRYISLERLVEEGVHPSRRIARSSAAGVAPDTGTIFLLDRRLSTMASSSSKEASAGGPERAAPAMSENGDV